MEFRVAVSDGLGTRSEPAVFGWANYNNLFGGDVGLRAGTSFDHHDPRYWMLQHSCDGHYFYDYRTGSAGFTAGYDVNTRLGSWAPTGRGGDAAQGGKLQVDLAVRGPVPTGVAQRPERAEKDCAAIQARLGSAAAGASAGP